MKNGSGWGELGQKKKRQQVAEGPRKMKDVVL